MLHHFTGIWICRFRVLLLFNLTSNLLCGYFNVQLWMPMYVSELKHLYLLVALTVTILWLWLASCHLVWSVSNINANKIMLVCNSSLERNIYCKCRNNKSSFEALWRPISQPLRIEPRLISTTILAQFARRMFLCWSTKTGLTVVSLSYCIESSVGSVEMLMLLQGQQVNWNVSCLHLMTKWWEWNVPCSRSVYFLSKCFFNFITTDNFVDHIEQTLDVCLSNCQKKWLLTWILGVMINHRAYL